MYIASLLWMKHCAKDKKVRHNPILKKKKVHILMLGWRCIQRIKRYWNDRDSPQGHILRL